MKEGFALVAACIIFAVIGSISLIKFFDIPTVGSDRYLLEQCYEAAKVNKNITCNPINRNLLGIRELQER